jgi:uncharacterized LabA/DUF88 family protein
MPDGVAYMTTPQRSPLAPPRTTVYIDGFNLYYGAVSRSPYRWLDIQRLCELLRPAEAIQRVVYFTAMVVGPTRQNQEAYLLALSQRPLVQVVEGNFKKKTIECLHPDCPNPNRRFFKSLEEKRTDVNIAIEMLDDAYQNLSDRMVLVSGDSDLVPALELRTVATTVRELPPQLLSRAQLPNPTILPDGRAIYRPAGWEHPKPPRALPPRPVMPANQPCAWCGRP